MSQATRTCTREEFFEWLNSCPATWDVASDDVGETRIKFNFEEEEQDTGD